MAMNQSLQVYKQNSVNTASPAELTVMLYNGCLKFIKLAKLAIEENNIEQRHINLGKAQDIIQELMVNLNMDVGLSKNLMKMYDYIHRRLIEANTKNDVEILIEVEGFVMSFRDTWKEAMQLSKKQYAESGRA